LNAKPTTAPAVGSAIFVLALSIRAVWWPRIFTESGVVPPHGADEFLHLRRIWYSVVHFPELLEFDAYGNHPIGGEIITPPGFDLAVAALARLLVGAQDQGAVEMVAAWVPAVLGALAAVTAFALASRIFGFGAGVVSGVLLALLPAHYYSSQVGYVDHHVAVSLLSALLALGAIAAQSKPAGRSWPVLAAALGLGAAAILLVSPGALLHLALFQGLAFIWMLQARGVGGAISRAWHLTFVQGLAAIALAPYALGLEWKQYGAWSPLVLCNFQPAWLAATAFACAALALLWSRTRWGSDAKRRWLAATALAALALVAAIGAIPEFPASIDQAASWFTEEEENYLSGNAEIQPLFAKAGNSDYSENPDAPTHLTRLIYVYPLALFWLFVSALRGRRPDRWLVFAWGAAFYVAVLSQLRFLNSFSLPFAIAMGGALAAAAADLRRRLAQRQKSVRIAAFCGLLGLGVFTALPSASFYSPRLARWWQPSETHDLPRRYVRSMVYRTVANWLKENSPTTAGYLDGARTPEYGVLAAWDMGHLLRYIAERPQVQDNFGIYGGREGFEAARRYFAARDEGEARSILTQLGVRYVLVDRSLFGQGANSIARQLYVQRGSAGEPSRLDLPPFEHHRLAMETSPRQPAVPHVMLYEIVRGARVEGRARPGSRVQIRLPIRSTERARPFAYRQQTTTDEAGIYRFVLPYATGEREPLRSGPHYRLQCGGESASLAVPEQAVDAGDAIAGPSLMCGAKR